MSVWTSDQQAVCAGPKSVTTGVSVSPPQKTQVVSCGGTGFIGACGMVTLGSSRLVEWVEPSANGLPV